MRNANGSFKRLNVEQEERQEKCTVSRMALRIILKNFRMF